MLTRLLIVLTFLGAPVPRVCTCAAVKSVGPPSAALMAETVKPKRCGCSRHADHAPRPANSAFCSGAGCDHSAPVGHEPGCPAAQPRPTPDSAPPATTPDLTPDAAVGSHFKSVVEVHPVADHVSYSGSARPPHVPLYITFLSLRN